MRMCGHKQTRRSGVDLRGTLESARRFSWYFSEARRTLSYAQATAQAELAQQIQKLTDAMARTQAQLEQSQRQLDEMRMQLSALQRQMAQSGSSAAAQPTLRLQLQFLLRQLKPRPQLLSAAIQDLRERQAMQESQIATHEQIKGGKRVEISGEDHRLVAAERLCEYERSRYGGHADRRASGARQHRSLCAANGARSRCARPASVRRSQLCRSARGFRRQSGVQQFARPIPATITPIPRCCGSAPLTLACNGSIQKLISRWIVRSSALIRQLR